MTMSHEPDARRMSDAELDQCIRCGWEVWCDLLDDMLNTGGMLPSRELAGRVTSFFEDAYWRAEESRTEVLRRQMTTISRGRPGRDSSRSVGLV